jgi:hypothetical protein
MSIVSGYGLDDRAGDRGLIPGRSKEDFSFTLCPDRLLDHQVSRPVCTGDKARLGRNADHTPPSSAEVVNEEI